MILLSAIFKPCFSCFRNVVYNLSLTDLTEQRRLVWYSPENDVKMCVVKGKDEVSLCLIFCINSHFTTFSLFIMLRRRRATLLHRSAILSTYCGKNMSSNSISLNHIHSTSNLNKVD